MALDVRLAVPSNPPKAQRPSDLSLRSALLKAKEEGRLGGGSSSSSSGGMGSMSSHAINTALKSNSKDGKDGKDRDKAKKSVSMPASAVQTPRTPYNPFNETMAGVCLGKGTVPTTNITSKARHEQVSTHTSPLPSLPASRSLLSPTISRPFYRTSFVSVTINVHFFCFPGRFSVQFFEAETRLRLSAELCRQLSHPQGTVDQGVDAICYCC